MARWINLFVALSAPLVCVGLVDAPAQAGPAPTTRPADPAAALRQALREADALPDATPRAKADFLAGWMAEHAGWRGLKVKDLAALARHVHAGKSDRCARQRKLLTDLAWRMHLGPATDPDELARPEVRALLDAVRPSLTDAQRRQVAERLRPRLGDASGRPDKLKPAELLRRAGRLAQLDRQQGADFVAAWMTASDAWEGSPPRQLLSLLGHVRRGGSATAKESTTALAEHVCARYLDAGAAGEAAGTDLLDLALHVHPLLSKDRKAELAKSIPTRFVESDLLHKMRVERLSTVQMALRCFGVTTAQGDVASAWMERNPWTSLDAKQLALLAGALRRGGPDAAKKQKAALAEHIWRTWLDPSAGADLDGPEMRKLVAAVRPLLSDEQRTALAARMAKAYAGIGKPGLTKLTMADLYRRAALLAPAKQAEFIAAWTAATDQWHKAGVRDLMSLLARLTTSKSGPVVKQQKAVVAFIYDKHLGPEAPPQPTADLLALTHALPPLLTGDQTAQVLARFERHFAVAETVEKLSMPQLNSVATGLRELGKRDGIGKIAATWMARGDDWRKLEPRDLRALAGHLVGETEDVRRQKAVLARHVEAGLLAGDEAVRAVGLPVWRDLARRLAPALSPRAKTTWAGRIRKVFAPSGDALGAMKPADMNKLHDALASLSPAAAGAMMGSVVNDTDQWRSWEPREVYALVGRLASVRSTPTVARRRVLRHITNKVLPDEGAVKSLGLGQWRVLAHAARRDAAPGERRVWAKRLRSVFGVDPAKAAPTARDLAHLTDAVAALEGGGGEDPSLISAKAVAGGDAWKGWTPAELAVLAGRLARTGDAGAPARRRLAEHVVGAVLADAEAARSLTLTDWHKLLTHLAADVPPAARPPAAGKLRDAFAGAGPMALLAVEAKQFEQLVAAVDLLDGKLAAEMVTTRAHDRKTLSTASVADLVSLAGMTAAKNKFAAAPILDRLDHLYRSAPAKFTWRDCAAAARTWHLLANQPRTQTWAGRASKLLVGTEKARAAVTEADLLALSGFLREVYLLRPHMPHPHVAAAVAELAKRGALRTCDANWHHAVALGVPLGAPGDRQAVRAQLFDERGHVRAPVAKVLSWAYLTNGGVGAWNAFLDGRLAGRALQAKERVTWLLLRAYSASLPGFPSPSLGRKWLDEVIDLTDSEALKLRIIREVSADFAARARYDEGEAWLDAMGTRAPSPTVKKAIREARSHVLRGRIAYYRGRIAIVTRRAEAADAQAALHAAAGRSDMRDMHFRSARAYRRDAEHYRNALSRAMKASGSGEGVDE